MICLVIIGPSYTQAKEQITNAQSIANMVELRLDLFTHFCIDEIKELQTHCPLPMIFTIRSSDHYEELAALRPDYLDIEDHTPESLVDKIREKHPKIQLIRSHHNFDNTPTPLPPVTSDICKIACQAHSSIDCLRMLQLASETTIAISMGPLGTPGRLLAPIFGCPITFAALDECQHGQLKAAQYPKVNRETDIYGLIGDPVDKSIGDVTHNSYFSENKINAVYVKWNLKAHELKAFLRLAKQMPIRGLSVTMPLKEAIIPFLDEIDPESREIGAVNTLKFTEGKITGYNTDGVGALNALEKKTSVSNKHIVLLGAGGAAKAIAFEARKRGASVTVLNRDPARAKQLSDSFGSLSELTKYPYDILINCTPISLPIDPSEIRSDALVMDIKTSEETDMLKCAKEKGCQIVHGVDMFMEQAEGQRSIWL